MRDRISEPSAAIAILPEAEPKLVSSSSFWARLFRRAKPYLLPLAVLDCVVIYYFSLHLRLADGANAMVEAIGSFHARDPRVDAVIVDAQALLGKSIFALLVSAGGAALCIAAVVGLCWSARCLRKRKRLAAELQATLFADGKRASATVVDISDGGCRISLADPPACGASVRLSFTGELETQAKVVWRTDDQAGLQFLAPLASRASAASATAPALAGSPGPAHDSQNIKGCSASSSAHAWRMN